MAEPRRLFTAHADFEARLAALLAFESAQDEDVERAVADILDAVRLRGDEALLEYTRRFDRWSPAGATDLEVPPPVARGALARIGSAATLIGGEQATAHSGAFITSPYIIGDPAQKKIRLRRFGAAAIDMETAAVARAAAVWGIPVSCVGAVSDEAGDDFLAPFSYDPTAGLAGRAVRIAAAGNWIRRCKQWRIRAERARSSLNRFLRCSLEWVGREYPSTISP